MVKYSTDKPPGQDSLTSADENRSMFDQISQWYDGTNRLLSLGLDRRWRRIAVEALQPGRDGQYLDVGCGTGDIALEILHQNRSSNVTGIDPSEGMLEVGRQKVVSAGLSDRIELQIGDALNLGFPDEHFDGCITSFCIRNVTERERALREMHRVTRSGGKLVILELTEPTGFLMKPLFRLYSKVAMPLITGVLSSSSAYRYLADSMADFPSPGTIGGLMERTGFREVQHQHMTGGIVTLFVGNVA